MNYFCIDYSLTNRINDQRNTNSQQPQQGRIPSYAHSGEFDTSPIAIYTSDNNTISLDVKLENDTVWLNRSQIALLFDRDIKTIGKHFNNALKEELEGLPVVAKFATTAADGKTYQVEHYNIEMITSVGYRVKSKRGTQFRIWANRILKDYIVKGYAINDKIRLEHYNELKDVVRLMANTVNSQEKLTDDQSAGLLSVVTDYVYASTRSTAMTTSN